MEENTAAARVKTGGRRADFVGSTIYNYINPMIDKTKENIAEAMVESVTASIRSTLIQEGLKKAREQWLMLNAMLSTEDWWPPVARAARELLDDFAMQQQKAVNAMEVDAKNVIYISNDVAGQKQWNSKVRAMDMVMNDPTFNGPMYDVHSNDEVKLNS